MSQPGSAAHHGPWREQPEPDTLTAMGRALLELGPLPILVVQPGGEVTFANAAAGGWSWPGAGPVTHLRDLLHPDDAPAFFQALLVVPTNDSPVALPASRVQISQNPDVGPRWVRLEVSALRPSQEAQSSAATVLIWQVQPEHTDQADNDTRQIVQDTVRGRPLSEVFSQIARRVERLAPAYFCAVFLVQADQLTLAAAPSAPPEFQTLFPSPSPHPPPWTTDTPVGGLSLRELARALHITAPLHGAERSVLVSPAFAGVTWMPLMDSEAGILGAIALYACGAWIDPAGDVTRVLEEARHLATLAAQQHTLLDRLQTQAQRDALTGLPNRTLLTARLRRRVLSAQQCGAALSLLFIDIDDFKAINDTLGHAAGDGVLRQVARRLASCLEPHDTLARMGGNEFAVILSSADAEQTARRILRAFAAPLDGLDHELYVDLSIGISVGLPADTATPPLTDLCQTLMHSANLAMGHAKQHRSGYRVFGSEVAHQEEGAALPRLHLVASLRHAAEAQELTLHYQPQVQLETGRMVGVEALLRWTHSSLGPVSPAQFIPVAEASGLIVPIGMWVLRKACRQAAQWRHSGRPLRVAVNVSALQFAREDFVETVAACLEDADLPPEFLELELTERVVMTHVSEAAARMARLRDLGVSVSIDDFGTGYSSLSQLSRLPLSGLKIDRSFVSGLTPESPDFAVIQAVIGLSRSLGLSTTAEGIETWKELAQLQDLTCTLGQGFFLGRPVPADQLERDFARLNVWNVSPDPHPSSPPANS